MARLSGTAAIAESLIGTAVVSTTPVAGGGLCTATRLRLNDGRNAIIKTRPQAPAGFFAREAEGLVWLREAAGVAVPEVLGFNAESLVLEWVEPSKPTPDAAESFGRALAVTHGAGATSFGADSDGFIGTIPLPNGPKDSWPEFYASRRVMPYVKAAVDRGGLTKDQAAVIEAAMRNLPALAGPPEPPARLHGDLWSGNVVWGTEATVWVVDPAAHGGHRETDLAMLSLFGIPHLQRILDSYHEASPLADGWEERMAVHQLHPLLVHAVLSGGSYGSRAAATAQLLLDGLPN